MINKIKEGIILGIGMAIGMFVVNVSLTMLLSLVSMLMPLLQ